MKLPADITPVVAPIYYSAKEANAYAAGWAAAVERTRSLNEPEVVENER